MCNSQCCLLLSQTIEQRFPTFPRAGNFNRRSSSYVNYWRP